MDCKKIDLEKTNRFSSFFLDYLRQKDNLKSFYGSFPAIEHFEKQIQNKSAFPKENREVLYSVLQEQYSDVKVPEALANNISLLKQENTFTITTGHQLNIFTGPLYFIYKIITIINACKKLRKRYPRYNFVPVYWMASEDHDFEEISYFRYGGQKYSWSTEQTGAVGRFDPSSLKSLLQEFPGMPDFFKKAYSKPTLSDAVRDYVNHLFGGDGLVVLDADNPKLKKLFSSVIEDDLFNNSAKKKADETSEALEKLGYKAQIFPREINFFYLEGGIRERIIREDNKFIVQDTDIKFTAEELKQLVQNHPEKFSPNVVMRPLYEEVVLPNLAYVGGPAEIVYWLQLKPTFEYFQLPFPILMPRNFGMVIPKNIQQKIEKTKLVVEEFFEPSEQLFKRLVIENSGDILLNGQKKHFEDLFASIKAQAERIDPTLGPHVEAQKVNTQKRIDRIEKKFIRAEKRNQSDRLNQIRSIMDFLFPGGNLQERTDNFLNFYLENNNFINELKDCLDPFDYRFHIITYG